MFEETFLYKLIYVLAIPDDAHNGLLKIGDTSVELRCNIKNLQPNCKILNDAAIKRIKSYTNTAGIYFKLLLTLLKNFQRL